MKKTLENMKKKKGFTLVEVIIVLVVIAILAAVLIPSLTGYIDKANQKTAIANARSFVMAAQTISSEWYAEKALGEDFKKDDFIKEAYALSELNDAESCVTVKLSTKGKVTEVVFAQADYTVTYTDDGSFGEPAASAENVVKGTDNTVVSDT